MINTAQIPPEVVEAAARVIADANGWRDEQGFKACVPVARAAIAATINAWPGVKLENLCSWVMDGPDLPYVEETASIILPLSTEARDE